jgi:hypothetical protein
LSRFCSTKVSLVIDVRAAVSDSFGKRAASAWPTRLKAASTRRWAATMSGLRSSSSDGTPAAGVGGNTANTDGALISAAG